jgi:hypothetical protein
MPESENRGRLYNLWNLFGWFSSAPNNFTKEERKRNIGSGSRGGSTDNYYQSSTTPQSDHLSHMREMMEMSKYEMVQPVVDLYAEECTQPDINKGKVLWYTCSDSDVEKDLNKMLDNINIDDQIYPIAFTIASTGNCYRRILRNEQGVQQSVSVPTTEVARVWEPSTRRLIGFRWENHTPYTPDDQVSYLGDDTLFAPWEFIHFRRIADNDTEYGVALIESLFSLYRRIKLGIDQMVVYRLHTMPTRHIVWIDVGDQSIIDAQATAINYRNLLRNQISVDLDGGSFDQRWNPPATDSILFFPKRSDEETKVDKLEGTRDVPDIHDLELLFKMFFGGARVPKAYLGFEEDAGGLAKSSLVSQDIRFARMIRVLRRPIVVGFKRLAELHLAFRGLNPKDYKIEVEMSKISSIEEELNAANLGRQVELASTLTGLCQSLDIPNKEIIELVFNEYLHVPKDFVEIAKLAASIEKAVRDNLEQEEADMMGGGGMGGGMGGGIDDLGGELGLGDAPPDLGDDLGNEPPAPSGAEESSNSKGVVLLEQEFLRGLAKGVRAERKLLTESKGDSSVETPITKGLAEFRRSFKKLQESSLSSKTSLVERYRNTNTPLTETSYPITDEDKLSYRSLLETISEGGAPVDPDQHPTVRMVENMRNSSKGGKLELKRVSSTLKEG